MINRILRRYVRFAGSEIVLKIRKLMASRSPMLNMSHLALILEYLAKTVRKLIF